MGNTRFHVGADEFRVEAVIALQSGGFDVRAKLRDRRIHMDRSKAGTDIVKAGENIFQRRAAADHFGQVVNPEFFHVSSRPSATRVRNCACAPRHANRDTPPL